MDLRQLRTTRTFASFCILVLFCAPGPAQEPEPAAVIRSVDASVAARFESVLGFTDVEHYAVYRGDDQVHPAAEMTVRDTYKKGVGKIYTVLSQSGSSIFLHFGLKPLLGNEQTINQSGNVEKSWFNSANYEMKLNSAAVQKLNGRDCFALDIKPKQLAPNLIIGTMWVDAQDGTLVQIDGIASKNPSAFSGTTHMMRQYTNINGYSMAIHARAESDSALFGRTVVTIDYSNYNLEIKSGK
jgi:outer membrane lipoprotein-sorting protein